MKALTSVVAAMGVGVVLAGVAPCSMAADTYRWVDKAGRVTYSDRPPPPGVRQVEERQYGAAPAETVPGFALRKAAEDFPVAIYTADNCGEFCDSARDLLTRRGVPFTEHKITSEAERAAFLERFGPPDEVPAIAVGSQTFKGYESGRWNRMLDDAGYPRTPQPPR
ncbi:MAG: glutaredoxin family protein [Thauera sp.]|nr:glutaredoxin family protein [Thauera sp.]